MKKGWKYFQRRPRTQGLRLPCGRRMSFDHGYGLTGVLVSDAAGKQISYRCRTHNATAV